MLLKQKKITIFELPFSSKLQIQISQPFNNEFLEPIEDEFNSQNHKFELQVVPLTFVQNC